MLKKTLCLCLIFLCFTISPYNVLAEILFQEDFNTDAADVDRSVWTSPEGPEAFFGRTAIRNPNWPGPGDGRIKVSGGVARLILSTFNPSALEPGDSFWGSEIQTIQKFQPGEDGIAFESRVRSSAAIPAGVVSSMFCYALTAIPPADTRDEIDFEFLSNLYLNADPQEVFLNRYVNESGGDGTPVRIAVPGLDLTEFNIFKIIWYPDHIDWYVNGRLVYRATGKIPSTPMNLRFNIWAPESEWDLAYSQNFVPVANSSDNIDYIYEIDWVRVSRVKRLRGAVTIPLLILLD